MLPTHRLFRRAKVWYNAVGQLSGPPREPLLFPYPRWYSTASAGAQVSDTDTDTDTGGESSNWTQAYGKQGLGAGNEPSASQKVEKSYDALKEEEDANNRMRENWSGQAQHSLEIPLGDDAGHKPELAVSRVSGKRHKQIDPPRALAQLPKSFTSPIRLIEPKNGARVVKAATIRNQHQKNRDLVQRQHHYKGELSDNWRIPLQELEKYTPQGPAAHADVSERMTVQNGAKAQFIGNAGRTILDVMLRTGCQIHQLGQLDEEGFFESFVLSGSNQSVQHAKGILHDYIHIHTSQVTSEDVEGSSKPSVTFTSAQASKHDVIRAVWDTSSSERLPQRRADQTPRPSVWTTINLTNYIEDVTETHILRLMHRQLYASGESHIDAVTDILKGLFKDPEATPFLSIRAYLTALQFLVKYQKLPTARLLFLKLEGLGILPVPEFFNILLRTSAAVQDLHNFTFILKLMTTRGVSPNVNTWIALLMAIKPLEVKMHIVKKMQEKGMLENPSAIKGVAEQILRDQAKPFLNGHGQIIDFMRLLDITFKRKAWLSVSAANELLDELGARGRINEAPDVLSALFERGEVPNHVSLNTLLTHCARHRNEEAAVQIVTMFGNRWHIQPDAQSYRSLFDLAWHGRRYNMCRVIWAYACMDGSTSYAMQKRVLRSLKSARHEPDIANALTAETIVGDSLRVRWMSDAGSVIAGIGLAEQKIGNYKLGSPLAAEARSEKFREIVARSEDAVSETELDRRRTAKQLIGWDLAAVKWFRPKLAFTSMLAQALKLDKDWSHDPLRKERSIEWKLAHAINVPVTIGRFA